MGFQSAPASLRGQLGRETSLTKLQMLHADPATFTSLATNIGYPSFAIGLILTKGLEVNYQRLSAAWYAVPKV